MLKVLIADDEKRIRKGLTHLIDWNNYGFSISGAVSNGVEALEAVRSESFDLLITDICMPDMDGLELIKNVRTFNDKIRIIVLSGHDNFSYAQKAVQYAVDRYLLKPIEEDELIESLCKIQNEYEESNAANKEYAPALLRNFLSGQHISSPQNTEIFKGKEFYYILSEPYIGDSSLVTAAARLEDCILRLRSAANVFLSKMEGVFMLPEQSGMGIVISDYVLESWSGDVSKFAEVLNTEMENSGTSADILVGKRVNGVSELYKSGESIKICREKKFYSKANEHVIICNGDGEFSLGLLENNLPDELVKAAVHGGYAEIKNKAASLCEAFRQERVSPATVMLHIDDILVELLKEVEAMGGDCASLLLKRTTLGKTVNITINTVRLFLEELCEEAADIITSLRRETSTKAISDIVLYIRENYKSDISLKLLAEKFFIYPNYLGRMFKKSTGVSFNTFLNKIRIDEAKKLLRRSDCKVYEIAFQVGFKDSNYFIVKFEELEGMSPTQYRDGNPTPSQK